MINYFIEKIYLKNIRICFVVDVAGTVSAALFQWKQSFSHVLNVTLMEKSRQKSGNNVSVTVLTV
jgi:hypothetical protein